MNENKPLKINGNKRLIWAVGFLTLAALVSTGYWFIFMKGTVYSDDARLDGDLVDLGSQSSGFLTKVSINEGDQVEVDIASGMITNTTTGKAYQANALPGFLLRIVDAGGIIPYLKEHDIQDLLA